MINKIKSKYKGRITNNVNATRMELLVVSDLEMSFWVKHPSLKINTEFPTMVNYCKEYNFGISLNENFCVSRVSYNEEKLQNAKVKIKFKTFLFSPCQTLKNCNKAANFDLEKTLNKMKGEGNQLITESPTLNSLKKLKKKIVKKKSLVPNFPIQNKLNQSSPNTQKNGNIEDPIKKEDEGKDHKPHLLVDKDLLVRNDSGSYLNNPLIYQKIAKSFKYIRSLPIVNNNYNKPTHKSPENKKKEQEDFAKQCVELEQSLIIKDGLDVESKQVKKKITKMRFKLHHMEEQVDEKGKLKSLLTPMKVLQSKKSIKMSEEMKNDKDFLSLFKRKSSKHLSKTNMFESLGLFVTPDHLKKEEVFKSNENEDLNDNIDNLNMLFDLEVMNTHETAKLNDDIDDDDQLTNMETNLAKCNIVIEDNIDEDSFNNLNNSIW